MKANFDGIVFVYQHKKTNELFVRSHDEALVFEIDKNYEHIATLNAAAWIERHYNSYDSAKEFGTAVAEKTAKAYWPTPAKNNIEKIVDEVMKK